jgi:heat-inducible transcriptional repressor
MEIAPVMSSGTRPPHQPPFDERLARALDGRSREIFRHIVESYLGSGEPVGSRNLSRIIPISLSPATVRNVMADLEAAGLIYSPHTSAGRLPSQSGLRFFVDSMMEIGDPSTEDKARIEAEVKAAGQASNFEGVLAQASALLSGLSRGAGVVAAGKGAGRLKHIEFVRLDASRALVILVSEDGGVENRLIDLPPGLPASALTEATNFLNDRTNGRTLPEVRAAIELRRVELQSQLDSATAELVNAGLAVWSGRGDARQLIVRGQANLLEDLSAAEDLERIRLLFADLETQHGVLDLLSRAESGEGVRIFIGSENKLFSLSGSSLIAAPFRDANQRIVGVLGIIGPTRLNYAKIVPMVDFTAKVVSKMLEAKGG